MKIAVCIKWIPVVSRMKFDAETRRIVREGVPSEVNNWDIVAVQRAAELREEFGGTVTAITMGPPQARDGLARCIAQGADEALHISDMALAGSDTLATSRVLAAALRRGEYDLILFGNFSVDAETGQVGPEVAEMLGLPQITGASKLDVVGGTTVRAERNLDDAVEVLEVALPAVVTVADGVAGDAFPGREALTAAKERDIPELTIADLGLTADEVGVAGSPTWVADIRIQESGREPLIIEEVPVADAAAQVVALLKERGVLDPALRIPRTLAPAAAEARAAVGQGVWVVAELGDAGPRPVTLELLAAAGPVADAIGGHVSALLMGPPGVSGAVATLVAHGADVVMIAEDEGLAEYSTDAYTETLSRAIEREQPYAVLLPSTPNGRDLAGRVAARLSLGLTGDCIGIEVDPEGRLAQLKPAFGGSVIAPIYSKTLPHMATVRPGIMEALAPTTGRDGAVRQVDVRPTTERVRRVEVRAVDVTDVAELDTAWAIIGVGNGVGADGMPELGPLRELLDARYVVTRDVADAGWMPRQLQVGLTGRSVAPALYVGVALRGDYNHMVGLQRAGVLVCVNNNRRSSIFRGGVDVAVLADWHEFVPALTEALRPELGQS
jgi:electron transfer flavoprotein alpha subunit